ncbi:MBL fold metallo-hydrolase, partial [Oxalobacteraceae bacterium OM1]
LIDFGAHRLLIDPMLAPRGALPPLKVFGRRERNPVVNLPANADALLASITHCLLTHCQKGHFDHLDGAGKRWLRERQIPVVCTPHDAAYLRQRGLNVAPLPAAHHVPQPFLGGRLRTVPCRHGRGAVGLLMEHGVGYFLELPGEPTLYIAGDTVLTRDVLDFVAHHQPAVALVPAGGARFDMGQEIIMGTDEVIALTRATTGVVVANHLEALSHCPVKRSDLHAAAVRAGVDSRLYIPADGQTLAFSV